MESLGKTTPKRYGHPGREPTLATSFARSRGKKNLKGVDGVSSRTSKIGVMDCAEGAETSIIQRWLCDEVVSDSLYGVLSARESGDSRISLHNMVFTCNEPFGSRSEPGIQITRKIHQLSTRRDPGGPGQSSSDRPPSPPAKADLRPVLEPGVTTKCDPESHQTRYLQPCRPQPVAILRKNCKIEFEELRRHSSRLPSPRLTTSRSY